eukprot:TRINITY_DN2935_c0_g1_i3.p1 TRINITY_DN2935_c0_g1~~TRINITY_DN2935_c0_g1_i3.p1  ORF type:complete len:3350 (-),score=861.62 TRINITY_DN2935_c0_g1_i3:62-10111(-)
MHSLTSDQFDLRWALLTWPKRIDDKVQETSVVQDHDKTTFLKQYNEAKDLLSEKVQSLAKQVQGMGHLNDISQHEKLNVQVKNIMQQIKDLQDQVKIFNRRERLFSLEQNKYEDVTSLLRSFEPFYKLWTTTSEWITLSANWMNDPFSSLKAEVVEQILTDGSRTMFKLSDFFKENKACLAIAQNIKQQMEDFSPKMPLIQSLSNPGMRKRHWDALAKELGFVINIQSVNLSQIIAMNLEKDLPLITKVTEHASKEFVIEAALDKMEKEWETVKFEVKPYRNTGTYIISATDDIGQMLDDHLVMTQTMSFSVYKKPFEDRITNWEDKLKTMLTCLDEWLTCQRTWLYLEPIFSSDDINRQMPTEGKRYESVNKMWRQIMQLTYSDPLVIHVAAMKKTVSDLKECHKLLDLIQNGLSEYLTTKQAAFPRFYFLSNKELLEILSQTKDPTAVQPHLRKCFENVSTLEFQEDKKIVAMNSAEKEQVSFLKSFYPSGNVENWLKEVEVQMRISLHHSIRESIVDYTKIPRTQWVQKWPGQCVLAGSHIFWTTNVENALRMGKEGVAAVHKSLLSQLSDLSQMVRGELGDLSSLSRMTLGALIVMDIHQRDVVATLKDQGVDNEQAFEWISQLRYYYEEDELVVKMVSASFIYGYEYLGNTGRLVITPLTDQCYMTLTGALNLQLGGAPQGPAGTGKTETTKDLAKSLAKQCVVFNCSDGLTGAAMAKFFKGVATSGAWACLDEFNRIELEVLSVVAQQIISIQRAISANAKTFTFIDCVIPLEPSCAVFVTMNPGYAGRTELPDNLKALFRPVAMMVPDYAMIAEIMLFSFGFSNAQSLAQKMVATFRLSSEQLSSQDHYDFGMRAVKTVISAAGNLKKEDARADEDLILIRALSDCNVPKFLADDLPLFYGIMSDLFPGKRKPKIDYGNLESEIIKQAEKAGLQPVPHFITKCIQLYETTIVRHGLMLVGPTGGGKTQCYRILASAMTSLNKKGDPYQAVKYSVMNPKSITMGQLYGEVHKTTAEWTEGVLAMLIREDAQDMSPKKKWTVFDGPVDAVWIENLNTVLDDNKKLCLTSGEIIALTPHQTMMFEVEDLAVASPATVSRCGMIYMEPGDIGVKPLILTALQKLPDDIRSQYSSALEKLYDDYFEKTIGFLRSSLKEVIPTSNVNLTQSHINLMECLMKPWYPITDELEERTDPPGELSSHLESFFIFGLIWSVGGTTDLTGRTKFDAFLRSLLVLNKSSVDIPLEGTCYDYRYDSETKTWSLWLDLSIPVSLKTRVTAKEFANVIVPTVDTKRYTYLLDLLVKNGKQVLCTGPTGTGKSVIIKEKIINNMPNRYQTLILSFSAQTSANQTQDIIDGKIDKRRKGVFGPPPGKKLIIFVDDVNMPKKERYGAQPPIELLRQWLDHRGWYDRKALQAGNPPFKEIIDVQFVCAMGPPGGGRNPITARFTRHFNLISFTQLQTETLQHIFSTILSNFLEPFADSVKAICSPLVQATVEVYNTCTNVLLPTPARAHYTFNLRDLAKVFQGLCCANKGNITSPSLLLQLWVHECSRVFSDRLIDDNDRGWFQNLLKKITNEKVGLKWDDVMGGISRLIFADFMDRHAEPDNRVYTRLSDMNALVKFSEESLEYYNQTSKTPMKLVMFLEAIEHVARVSRVIRQPQGNALLLGVGGSGRKSSAYLAASMAGYDVFQIEISSKYGVEEWHEDIKKMLMAAGLENKPTVFVFDDIQILEESFLEDINSILNSGEVPNIWLPEELESIYTTVRPLCENAGLAITKESIYNFFIQLVRNNFHMVICMSPVGDVFRDRLRMFPSLVNCCTIDWFSGWPDDALKSVAMNFLSEMQDVPEDMRHPISEMCIKVFRSVEKSSLQYKQELNRSNYVTPTSYLELLTMFKKIISFKKADLMKTWKRMDMGIEKLNTAAKDVAILQAELQASQPLLEKANADTLEMMSKIEADRAAADVTRTRVKKDEVEAEKKSEETKAIAADAQRDLDEALPALQAAEQALNALNKNDITEVRSMLRPPAGVKMVMEAICIIKQVKPKKVDGAKMGTKENDYWEPAKLMLTDPNFLNSLITFDKDNVPEAVIKQLAPYIENEDFRPLAISKVSKACTSLCLWVRAIEKYYHVAKGVEPKRQRLREAEDILAEVLGHLRETKAQLAEVEKNIADLQAQFDSKVAEKQDLENKVKECTTKLERAKTLIDALGEESIRWTETRDDAQKKIDNLLGDSLIAASTIAFSGVFVSTFRIRLMKDWQEFLSEMKIPHTPGCNMRSVLGDALKERHWTIDAGLPSDTVSIENALIISHARRWPLMIDPQGQANKWVKKLEKDRGLDVIKLSQDDYLRTLENAIRFGKPVLLENVGEELEPALDTVLLKQTFKQGGNVVIKFGDAVIPYHDDFQLYITTKHPNPHYKPELSTKVTLLNFTITQEGLTDQLLGLVVSKDRPDLEEAKNQLVMMNFNMQRQLHEFEDKMLRLMSESAGNPLEDLSLINTLGETKKASKEIKEKMIESIENEKSIDATRSEYFSIAQHSSVLFFCITDLAAIDPMYQYSLNWFINLYTMSIKNSEKSDDVKTRLASLSSYFTYSLYTNVCRSLFVAHKLLFSFILCIRLMQNKNLVDQAEWRFLLAGGTWVPSSKHPNPASEWLANKGWEDLMCLSDLPAFKGFADDLVTNIGEIKRIFDSPKPHQEKLFRPWHSQLSQLERILVLRCVRADGITAAIQEFITANLGQKFIEPPEFDLAGSYKDSAPDIPLIFVLSPGADPQAELMRFADEMRMGRKIESISLGQGQGPKAEQMIHDGKEKGMWVLLQNCHLAVSWMNMLEKIVENTSPEKVHKDYRLWLTSMPSDKFPISVLQSGIKMTNEPPKGIKSNMLRAFSGFDDNFLSSCEKQLPYKKLLFGLCFFHAVILERRKFGPLGWNIPYDFTSGDLNTCVKQLGIFLSEYDEVPYKVLRFLAGTINYGGRVTDVWDKRTLATLLMNVYKPDILEDGYKLSESGIYYSPPPGNQKEYTTYLRTLPINDQPEVFGLHENADITYYQASTFMLLEQIQLLESGSGASSKSGLAREKIIIDSANGILERIPSSIVLDKPIKLDPMESYTTVLAQEIIRFNKLLKVIDSTLHELLNAIKGLVVMSKSLEQMSNSIYDNQVPALWAEKAYPSMMPLSSWVVDLEKRLDFLKKWIKNGIPNVFWISGFFFPQAFLTGTLQNYARKHTVSIDTLSFSFEVIKKPEEELKRPEEGCYVTGLFLEGARFNRETGFMDESFPKKLYDAFPVLWLKPQQNRVKPTTGVYNCPVYKILSRHGVLSTTGHSTNYVLTIEIPTDKSEDYWVKKGVAAVCGLKYVA